MKKNLVILDFDETLGDFTNVLPLIRDASKRLPADIKQKDKNYKMLRGLVTRVVDEYKVKSLDSFLDLLARLKKEHFISKIILLSAGFAQKSSDTVLNQIGKSPQEIIMKTILNNLGLPDNLIDQYIFTHGKLKDISKLYRDPSEIASIQIFDDREHYEEFDPQIASKVTFHLLKPYIVTNRVPSKKFLISLFRPFAVEDRLELSNSQSKYLKKKDKSTLEKKDDRILDLYRTDDVLSALQSSLRRVYHTNTCLVDTDCETDEKCSPTTQLCLPKHRECKSNDDCSSGEFCDSLFLCSDKPITTKRKRPD